MENIGLRVRVLDVRTDDAKGYIARLITFLRRGELFVDAIVERESDGVICVVDMYANKITTLRG